MQAGVPTELHVYRGAHHGFDRMVPQAAVSQRFVADRDAALRIGFSRSSATAHVPLPVT
jgi:acetyl esterase/lipase